MVYKEKDWKLYGPMRSEASGALALTAGGPGARLRAPGGVQGQRPGGGRGADPPKPQGFYSFKYPFGSISGPLSMIL